MAGEQLAAVQHLPQLWFIGPRPDPLALCAGEDLPLIADNLDAENLGIDPSIIAGRIRRERNDYTILSSIIGHNTVRSQFEEQET